MSWLPQNVHIDRNTTSPIIFSVSIYPQLAVYVLKLSTRIFFDVWPLGGTMGPYKMNKSIIKPKGILMKSTSRKSHKVQLRG